MPPVKRRYILFQIEPLERTLSFQMHEGDLVHAVREMVQKMFGDFGVGSILLNFHSKKFDLATRTGVVVVKRQSYKFISTTLPLIQQIRNQKVRINVLRISGTLRSSLRALQGFHAQMICNYKQMLKGTQQMEPNDHPMAHITSVEQINEGFTAIRNSLEEMRNDFSK